MDKLTTWQRIHEDEIKQLHYSMFEYTNLPPTVEPDHLEEYLQAYPDGYVAWWRLNASEASPGFPEGSLIVS